ncbi:MAG: hypothetical protein EON60_12375 [Alphaproteobacteria bacterium]|nr:MAG: hypothetical protein EON60_12375 [Alphaproteobacteria bacterium]
MRDGDIGLILHSSLSLLGQPDYKTRFLEGQKIHRSFKPSRIPATIRQGVATCLDYVYELVQLADRFTFEPCMDGYVPDVEMYHRHHDILYGYIVEIKTIYLNTLSDAYSLKVEKGKRQVKHGVTTLRHKTHGTMEIFGSVLIFLIYADGSPPEAHWKDVIHYVPPSA